MDTDDDSCWTCSHPEATHADVLALVREGIERRGWAVQPVLGTQRHAPLAYTVGLTSHGLPELVVTGRRAAVAVSMLDALAAYTVESCEVRAGETMRLGEVHLEAVQLRHPEAHLFVAAEFFGPALRAVQMVWADDRGRLPWEPGHRGGRGGQPVLGPRLSAG